MRLRPERTRLMLAVAALLATVSAGATDAVRASPGSPADPPTPVLTKPPFPDPTVEYGPSGLVAVSTGLWAPRASASAPAGPWTKASTALAQLPQWATGPEIWGSDLHEVRDRWLLYYSVPVGGAGRQGRCIGVATSDDPLGTFIPHGDRPLVCPRRADTPRAHDITAGQSGAIDPSVFVDSDGRLSLLYKTQGRPSTVRMVQLNKLGTRTSRMAGGVPRPSTEILRSAGTIENPVLVRRRGLYVLFTSQGNYRTCRYRTMWRRASSPTALAFSGRRLLLSRSTTGVCGPGGADVTRRDGVSHIFLHGWVCPALGTPDHACPTNLNADRDVELAPRRVMYVGRLKWTARDRPRVSAFLRPRDPG